MPKFSFRIYFHHLIAIPLLLLQPAVFALSPIIMWTCLVPGLDLAEVSREVIPREGDAVITVLRADTALFSIRYITAADRDSASRTPEEWAEKENLLAVINSGMYAKDLISHVGYLKHGGRVRQRRVLKTYKAALALDPAVPGLASVRFIDMECDDFGAAERKYRTLIQNIRMVSCRRKNVWSEQPDRWSIAALGLDERGRILFLFCESPLPVHTFSRAVLELPLGITRAMYLEGGGPAGIYINAGGQVVRKSGVRGTFGGSGQAVFQRLPNVLGLVRR